MRLNNYLNEANELDGLKNLLKNIPKIFLEDILSTKSFIVRGTYDNVNPWKVYTRRIDRQPVDTPIELHTLWDNAFDKIYGFKARSQGVFAISELSKTADYGKQYFFFPLGQNCEFIFSDTILDLFVVFVSLIIKKIKLSNKYPNLIKFFDLNKHLIRTSLELTTIGFNNEQAIELAKITEEIIKDEYTYYKNKPGSIAKLIKSKNEITFNCDKYLLVNQSFINKDMLLEVISDILKG